MKSKRKISPGLALVEPGSGEVLRKSSLGSQANLLFRRRLSYFFKKLFIFFWITSVFGYYLEITRAIVAHFMTNSPFLQPNIITIIPLSPPYGFGAIAVILFTLPLMKKYKLNPFFVLIINVFIAGVVEYLCAAIIVMVVGHSYFWNYSNQPFNINGYICLESSLLFGTAATLFLYLIYPLCDRVIRNLKKWQFNAIFWVLFIGYSADLINYYFRAFL